MAAPVLDMTSVILCSHGAPATPTAPNSRVLVNGVPTVVLTTTYVVAGCPFNISGGPSPCVTGQFVTGATRVTSNGLPLCIQGASSVCTPNGTPLTIASTPVRVAAQ